MDHPPIPPNCVLTGFWQSNVGSVAGHGIVIGLGEGDISLVKHDDLGESFPWRLIAASIASCAWLDLDREAALKEDSPRWLPSKAEENAEAWRVWGNQ